MAEPTQRKNFSEAVDGMLLKQTIADEPYKQEHDKVMKQWDRVLESPGFCEELGGFENYSGWLAAANKKNTAAKRLSGVTESHSEKDQLLDELIWLSARQKDGQEEAKERANPSK
ncbi:hypothetical protein Pcac1_g1418 [Phytophthora cactorum]|nr:hypothetical protein Pcac1_g1418 [Phytophthora cactorum]KAG2806728.1 hypothetical protein PC111_g17230 [Phytophthora cactorum]KAG3006546.1 hypothetical protein PC120_g17302 [Phytophthora cactorum]KAG3066905.1 hypothetical protein PC122_g17589 [Phytophthora cactorum]